MKEDGASQYSQWNQHGEHIMINCRVGRAAELHVLDSITQKRSAMAVFQEG
jgi:hypothetical protein